MKERPILMSRDNPKLILEDRKTHTRRKNGLDEINIRPNEWSFVGEGPIGNFLFESKVEPGERVSIVCPCGVAGDRLWVRETFRPLMSRARGFDKQRYAYRSDHTNPSAFEGTWKPSIHMPREASRLTLEILKVRVERLHDISEEDAKAEGMTPVISKKIHGWQPHVLEYSLLWDSLHGIGAWDKNPWVWVIEFRKL